MKKNMISKTVLSLAISCSMIMSMTVAYATVVSPNMATDLGNLVDAGIYNFNTERTAEFSVGGGYLTVRPVTGSSPVTAYGVSKTFTALPTTGEISLSVNIKQLNSSGYAVDFYSDATLVTTVRLGKYTLGADTSGPKDPYTYIDHIAVCSPNTPSIPLYIPNSGESPLETTTKINYTTNRINLYAGSTNNLLSDKYFLDDKTESAEGVEGAKQGYPLSSTLPINKIVIKPGALAAGMSAPNYMKVDYITLKHDDGAGNVTTIYDDQFNENKHIYEYGYDNFTAPYFFANSGAKEIGFGQISSNYKELGMVLPLKQPITSGKAVFEFTMEGTIVATDGTKTCQPPSPKGALGFFMISGEATKRVSFVQAGATSNYIPIKNGADAAQPAITSSFKYDIAELVQKFQVIADCDTGTLEIYRAVGESGNFTKISTDTAVMVADATGNHYPIDSITFYNYMSTTTTVKERNFKFRDINVYQIPTSEILNKVATPVIAYNNGTIPTALAAGQTVNAFVPVIGFSDQMNVILALYDENDTFIQFVKNDEGVPSDKLVSGTHLAKVSFTLPAGVKAGYKLRAFAWRNLVDLTPYTKATEVISQ